MDTIQLELFQSPGEHESWIFEQAKQAKKVVQDLYNKLDLNFPNAKNVIEKSCATLQLEITIDLVSDSDVNREPSSPRAFIWQFIPAFKLKKGDEEIQISANYQYMNESKVIKAWFNTLYTAKNFSQSEFLTIASQYFTLELLSTTLSDDKFINEIETKIGRRDLIIYFDYKLFPPNIIKPVDFMKDDIIKKVNNFYKKLLQLQKNNWYYIGIYEYFLDQNIFLTELDNNKKVMERRKSGSSKKMEHKTFNEIFQNDFLFLNNIAFINKEHNTHGWDSNYIISPEFFGDDFNKIDKGKLYNQTDNGEKREIYLYIKKRPDSNFFRADILIPNEKLTSEKFKALIAITHEIKNEHKEDR